MALQLFGLTIIIILTHAWGAILPNQDDMKSLEASLRQYHPSMSTIWMVDNGGRLAEVYLRRHHDNSSSLLGSVKDNVFYYLYTRGYNSAYQITINDVLRLRLSTFDPNHPTVVVIHGFWNTYQSDAVQLVREAYLNSYDVNVVGVDWGNLAKGPWYADAVVHTGPVGQQVAKLIDFLVASGANIQDIQLVGHSLGAHISAFASNGVTSGRITRITGLDPALPLFWLRPPEFRLDPSDADQVDCIHTCGGFLGFLDPLCSHDFYPNGGKASQPGCSMDLSGSCSHGRSYRFFSASMSMNFTAQRCSNFAELQLRQCSGSTGIMGGAKITADPGIYYLETVEDYPYLKS